MINTSVPTYLSAAAIVLSSDLTVVYLDWYLNRFRGLESGAR